MRIETLNQMVQDLIEKRAETAKLLVEQGESPYTSDGKVRVDVLPNKKRKAVPELVRDLYPDLYKELKERQMDDFEPTIRLRDLVDYLDDDQMDSVVAVQEYEPRILVKEVEEDE